MAKNKELLADLRGKTEKELEDRVLELRKEQFNLRFQQATGQLTNTARMNAVRKEIAKIMSVVGERQRQADAKSAKEVKG